MHTQYTIFLLTVCLLSLPLTGRAQSSIRIGDVHQGSLTPSDKRIDEDGSHYDWYVLKARSGQRVLIELKSDDFDPYLVLLDRDGAEIRSNSGVRTNRSARIELTLPYTEKYHIRVNSLHKDGLGDYTLTIKGAS